jgi:hypothetical protein
MSADGREVAFVTTAVSNLAGPGTPALQVAVRNLATLETELVSVEYDPTTGQAIPNKPVSAVQSATTYGAVYTPSTPFFPFTNRAYELTPAVGASISADGTTVAWLGRVVYKQAKMLSAEQTPSYAEPLWRRIADGPLAPTRRVTGGSEADSPACIASGETKVREPEGASLSDPCQGPFAVEAENGVWAGSIGDAVPQLSGDGYTVAFLATAQLVSLGVDFGRSGTEESDLYIANMHEGLTRVQALRPLTELASGHGSNRAADAPIVDVGISPDASQVAFSTQRTEFPLGSPTYVSQPAAVPAMAELFDVDLLDDTLTRVTGGYAGGPSEHPHKVLKSNEEDPYEIKSDGALSPSFGDSGNLLAFSSTASNLVYGDGNTPPLGVELLGSVDGSDVFYLSRKLFPPTPAETYVSSAPANPQVASDWNLGVTALSLPNGSVRLFVQAPGVGSLLASAASAVPVAGLSHAGSRAAAKGRRSKTKRARTSATVVDRSVATARQSIGLGGVGLLQLTLTLAPSYRALASRSGGLSGTATVVFRAPGHPTLRESIGVSFATKAKASRAKASHASRRSASRRRGRR